MLNPKTNVGKLRNDVLMTLFAYFENTFFLIPLFGLSLSYMYKLLSELGLKASHWYCFPEKLT